MQPTYLFYFILLLLLFVALSIESRASHILGKHFITELNHQLIHPIYYYFFNERGREKQMANSLWPKWLIRSPHWSNSLLLAQGQASL
jgi:hypothetical protein